MSATTEATLVAEGFALLEGPRWHDGRLYLSDMFGGVVLVLEADDSVTTLFEVPQDPSGIGFAPGGELIVSSMRDRRLLRYGAGRVDVYADLSAVVPDPINDMVVDVTGRAYIGNFGSNVYNEPLRPTALTRVDPDGKITRVGEGLVFPNGMAITPDGGTLIVAETFAHRVSCFDIEEDGELSERRTWASFAAEPAESLAASLLGAAAIPDGIALDAEGAIWVANPKAPGIERIGAGGAILDRVDTGTHAVYAAALGGSERRTLYLCAAPPLGQIENHEAERRGVLLRCEVDVPGAGIP